MTVNITMSRMLRAQQQRNKRGNDHQKFLAFEKLAKVSMKSLKISLSYFRMIRYKVHPSDDSRVLTMVLLFSGIVGIQGGARSTHQNSEQILIQPDTLWEKRGDAPKYLVKNIDFLSKYLKAVFIICQNAQRFADSFLHFAAII